MSGLDALVSGLEAVDGVAVRGIIAREAQRVGLRAQRLVREGYLTGQRLQVRSGRLRASVEYDVRDEGAAVTLALRAGGGAKDVRYARLQEYGGIVKPVVAKYLAIPVGPALTGRGTPRYPSPRDVPGLTFALSRRGQPMLVKRSDERRGKRRTAQAGEVWYLLRRSVTIRGVHYLRDARDAAAAALPVVIAEAVTARLVAEVRRGGV